MQNNVLFPCKLEWLHNKYKASSLCLTYYEKPLKNLQRKFLKKLWNENVTADSYDCFFLEIYIYLGFFFVGFFFGLFDPVWGAYIK